MRRRELHVAAVVAALVIAIVALVASLSRPNLAGVAGVPSTARSEQAFRIGMARFREARFDEAVTQFGLARERLPGNASIELHARALYNEGTALVRAGRYRLAIERLDRLLRARPDHVDGAFNRSIASALLGGATTDPEGSRTSDATETRGASSVAEARAAGRSPMGAGAQAAEDATGEGDTSPDGANNRDPSTDPGGAEAGERAGRNAVAPDDPAPGAQTLERTDRRVVGADRENGEGERPGGADGERDRGRPRGEPRDTGRSVTAGRFGGETLVALDESKTRRGDAATRGDATSETHRDRERRQAVEQWLRRIPDEPGALLRRKLEQRHRRDYPGVGDGIEP